MNVHKTVFINISKITKIGHSILEIGDSGETMGLQ